MLRKILALSAGIYYISGTSLGATSTTSVTSVTPRETDETPVPYHPDKKEESAGSIGITPLYWRKEEIEVEDLRGRFNNNPRYKNHTGKIGQRFSPRNRIAYPLKMG